MHMGVFESIKGLLGGEDRAFEYVCQHCEAEFESEEPKVAEVQCPECSSTQIRSVKMA